MDNTETFMYAKIYPVETELTIWLQSELEKRNWSQSELARRSGLSHGTVSNILSGTKGVGEASLNAIAKALHVPSEVLFRKAGLLPEVPEKDEQIEELLYLYNLMPDQYKSDLLSYAQIRIAMLEREGKIST